MTREINIHKKNLNPRETRSDLDEEQIKALAHDIQKNGLLPTYSVRKRADMTIHLAFEHNRHQTCIYLDDQDGDSGA